MAITGTIKPLKDKHGNYIFPETSSEAVYSLDGKTIEQKINHIESDTSRLTTDKTITGAINELFTNVSNGKSILASAITDKGIPTLATDSFETMKNNIMNISGGSTEIQTDYMTFSGESINVTHTIKGKTKNLSLISYSICGTPDSNGNYLIKYNVNNGADPKDKRFKKEYIDLKLPYPLLGNSEKYNEVKQRDDGKFEFIKRCELSDEKNKWTAKYMNSKISYGTSQLYNEKIYYLGGYNGTDYLKKIEVYDIYHNIWTECTPMSQPRMLPSSILYKGKIYVIGGKSTSTTCTNVLEIYDIENDSWSTGSSMNLARYGASATLYNGKIYVVGGQTAGSSYIDTLEIYDIENDSWTMGSVMPTARCYLTSHVYNGKIYCMYGYNKSYINTIEIYDIETDEWTTPSIVTNIKRGYCGSVLYNKKIYCFGGFNGFNYTTEVEVYDLETNSISIVSNLVTARSSISCQVYDDKVYCLGGKNSYYTSVIEVYDLKSHNFIDCYPDMPGGYRYYMGSSIYNNKIYCIGGSSSSNSYCDSLEIYDIDKKSWTIGANLPFGKYRSTSVIVDNKLYSIGGFGKGGGSGYNYLNIMHIYDIEKNTWTEGPSMSYERCGATSHVYNGKIYVIGGYGDSGVQNVYHSTIEVYDIESATWESTKISMPDKRAYHTSQLYEGKIYIIGGSNNYSTEVMYIYDIDNNKWTKGSNLPYKSTAFSSEMYNGNIYVIGIGSDTETDKVLIYNIEKNTWTQGIDMNCNKYSCSLALYNGKIYTIGGYDSKRKIPLASVDTYILNEINSDFIEEIIPIDDDLNFLTYNHITNIVPLNTVNPIITADFLVEV